MLVRAQALTIPSSTCLSYATQNQTFISNAIGSTSKLAWQKCTNYRIYQQHELSHFSTLSPRYSVPGPTYILNAKAWDAENCN